LLLDFVLILTEFAEESRHLFVEIGLSMLDSRVLEVNKMTFSKKRILCVDDDVDSCELIDHILVYKEKDFILTTASSPGQALTLIAAHPFDLYILDYRMPEMSGVELCRYIRLADSRTPILFFTAKAYPEDRKTAMEAGASGYLVKPNDLERFQETVRWLLEKTLPAVCPDFDNTERESESLAQKK
jgi:CheY-like chemotaxis protein